MPTIQASPFLASLFLERLLTFLIPYFSGFGADLTAARSEALETLTSYGARTRAELICAVQIILFSFAALDTLAAANIPEMSPSMRLRFRGCANNLNRSSQKTEQALAKRLAVDAPEATAHQADPINDLPDAEVEEMLRQTQAKIAAYRNQASTSGPTTNASAPKPAPQNLQPATLTQTQPATLTQTQPATLTQTQPDQRTRQQTSPLPQVLPSPTPRQQSVLLTQEEQNRRLWGAAMMDTLAQMGMPVQPVPTGKVIPAKPNPASGT